MSVRIINADVFEGLAQLEDESVQCVVTSPPYWGLRDYGTARWEGGSSSCDHVAGELRTGLGLATLGEKYRGGGHKAARADAILFRSECGKCGARRVDNQIGMEETLADHVEALVRVFREVRRVLRKDGVVWLNYGDAYATSQNGTTHLTHDGRYKSKRDDRTFTDKPFSTVARSGLKSKDLIMLPARIALALQDDGWWIRSEIIWHKPNPMPESIKDRPTSAHEKIYLLTKSAKYFYDAEAIREGAQYSGPNSPASQASPYGQGYTRRADELKRIGSKGNANGFRGGSYVNGEPGKRSEVGNGANETLSRNKRNVWTIATTPYSEAHFATFPPELPETCIKAGSRIGDMILDPFGGAGTTGLVADQLGRDCILIELNPEYAAMAERRIQSSAPLFAQVETTASEKQLDLEDSLSGNP